MSWKKTVWWWKRRRHADEQLLPVMSYKSRRQQAVGAGRRSLFSSRGAVATCTHGLGSPSPLVLSTSRTSCLRKEREREEKREREAEDRLDERKLLSEKMGKRIPVVSPASQQDISNFFLQLKTQKEEREEQKFEGRAYSHQSRHSSEMSTHFSARNLFPSLSASRDSHTSQNPREVEITFSFFFSWCFWYHHLLFPVSLFVCLCVCIAKHDQHQTAGPQDTGSMLLLGYCIRMTFSCVVLCLSVRFLSFLCVCLTGVDCNRGWEQEE